MGKQNERELREVFTQGELDGESLSRALIEKVHDLGLQPFEAP